MSGIISEKANKGNKRNKIGVINFKKNILNPIIIFMETKCDLVAGYQVEGTSKEGIEEIGNEANGNESHDEDKRKENSCFVMGSDTEEGYNLLTTFKMKTWKKNTT